MTHVALDAESSEVRQSQMVLSARMSETYSVLFCTYVKDDLHCRVCIFSVHIDIRRLLSSELCIHERSMLLETEHCRPHMQWNDRPLSLFIWLLRATVLPAALSKDRSKDGADQHTVMLLAGPCQQPCPPVNFMTWLLSFKPAHVPRLVFMPPSFWWASL